MGSHVVEVLLELAWSEHPRELAVAVHGVVCKAGIDGIDGPVLAVGEPELVGHAVCHELGVSANVVVSSCASRDGHDHHQCY